MDKFNDTRHTGAQMDRPAQRTINRFLCLWGVMAGACAFAMGAFIWRLAVPELALRASMAYEAVQNACLAVVGIGLVVSVARPDALVWFVGRALILLADVCKAKRERMEAEWK